MARTHEEETRTMEIALSGTSQVVDIDETARMIKINYDIVVPAAGCVAEARMNGATANYLYMFTYNGGVPSRVTGSIPLICDVNAGGTVCGGTIEFWPKPFPGGLQRRFKIDFDAVLASTLHHSYSGWVLWDDISSPIDTITFVATTGSFGSGSRLTIIEER